MTYELAKELQAAGFRQFGKDFYLYKEAVNGTNATQLESANYHHAAYEPSLEELIEACGDNLSELENTYDGWRAYCSTDNAEYWAKTNIEAVARLWLALHANGGTT